MIKDSKSKALYQLQEDVLGQLKAMGDPQFGLAKLCGGTALSRCWLGHRVSYDLDFFLPEGFDAGNLTARTEKIAGLYHRKLYRQIGAETIDEFKHPPGGVVEG